MICADTDEPVQPAGTLGGVAQCASCYLEGRKEACPTWQHYLQATGPKPRAPGRVHRRTATGDVRCSWCEAPAGESLWAPGWPERWIGDACRRHAELYGRRPGLDVRHARID